MFTWISTEWTRFEAWCATWAPGVKTKTVTALGAIGSAAALGQEYITNMPTNTFITGTQLTVASLVLFTLAFWFRRLTDYSKPAA